MKNTHRSTYLIQLRFGLFITLLAVPFIILDSCGSNNSGPKLYTKTLSYVGDDVEKAKKERDSVFSVVTDEYFEISLYSMSKGVKYRASREIEKPKVGEEFRLVELFVTDESGKTLFFPTSTDFLNHMAKSGYEMVDQKKAQYRTDYTFKRKPV